MAQIILKGQKLPIVIDYDKAVKLKSLFLDDKILPTAKISLDDWVGTKADIKSIWLNSKDNNDTKIKRNSIDDEVQKHIEWRKGILSMTIEDKASRLSFFHLVYFGFMNTKSIPNEVEEKAKQLQKKFFINNQYRTIPDLIIYKDIFGDNVCSSQVGSIIKMAVSSDAYYAKNDIEYFNQNSKELI